MSQTKQIARFKEMIKENPGRALSSFREAFGDLADETENVANANALREICLLLKPLSLYANSAIYEHLLPK